jgi:hypothetical protein
MTTDAPQLASVLAETAMIAAIYINRMVPEQIHETDFDDVWCRDAFRAAVNAESIDAPAAEVWLRQEGIFDHDAIVDWLKQKADEWYPLAKGDDEQMARIIINRYAKAVLDWKVMRIKYAQMQALAADVFPAPRTEATETPLGAVSTPETTKVDPKYRGKM